MLNLHHQEGLLQDDVSRLWNLAQVKSDPCYPPICLTQYQTHLNRVVALNLQHSYITGTWDSSSLSLLHQLHQDVVCISATCVAVHSLGLMAGSFKDVGSKLLQPFPLRIILVGGRIVFFTVPAIRHTRAWQLHTRALLLEVLSLEMKKEGRAHVLFFISKRA